MNILPEAEQLTPERRDIIQGLASQNTVILGGRLAIHGSQIAGPDEANLLTEAVEGQFSKHETLFNNETTPDTHDLWLPLSRGLLEGVVLSLNPVQVKDYQRGREWRILQKPFGWWEYYDSVNVKPGHDSVGFATEIVPVLSGDNAVPLRGERNQASLAEVYAALGAIKASEQYQQRYPQAMKPRPVIASPRS